MFETDPGGLIGTLADPMNYGRSAWWLLAIMALPGFFLLRISVPFVSGHYDLMARVRLVGGPLLWATIVADLVIWDPKLGVTEQIDSACLAWVVFVVSALIISAVLYERSERWPKSFGIGDSAPMGWITLLGVPAFLAAFGLVVAVPVVGRWIQTERIHSEQIDTDDVRRIPLAMNTPVNLLSKNNYDLKLGLEVRTESRLLKPQIRVRSKTGEAFVSPIYITRNRGVEPGLERVPGTDPVEVCLTEGTNCGMSGDISAWPRIFAGQRHGADSSGDSGAAKANLVVIPVVSPIVPNRLNLGDPQRTRFSGSFALGPGQNAFEFELPALLALKAQISPVRELDAVLILESLSSPIHRWTSLETQMPADHQRLLERPSISVTVPQGPYRLCVRLFDYFNLECDGLASELLTTEPVELTVEAPPQNGTSSAPRGTAP